MELTARMTALRTLDETHRATLTIDARINRVQIVRVYRDLRVRF
jgi:hypothetical protein